jgi:hypothetical protein
MTGNDAHWFTRVLRDRLDSDEDGLSYTRLAELVYEEAISCHFAHFKLLVEMVDGPVDPESAPGGVILQGERDPSDDCLQVDRTLIGAGHLDRLDGLPTGHLEVELLTHGAAGPGLLLDPIRPDP